MKEKYFWKVLIGAFLFSILTACGGSGGGGGGGPIPLATGTFTKIVPTAPADISTGGFSATPYIRFQFLYPASATQASGNVTGISVQYRSALASSVSCPNVTIKLGHTNLTNLTTTFANNVQTGQGSQITVLNDSTVTFPAGAAGTYYTIPLTTPFNYNGADNLVVEFERTSACSGSLSDEGVINAGYTAMAFTTTNGSPTGTTGTGAQIYKLVFAGGDNRVTAADGAGVNGNFYAPASQGRAQYLILASDIVGSGPVTGIQFTAFSALAAPMTATYKLTLSHVAPATTMLGTTFASNVGTNATVVANAVTVSLTPGTTEWWVPLTGSFNYNGTSNLLVDVEATAVTGGFIVQYQNSGGVRIMADADPAAATGTSPGPRGLEPKLRFNGGTMDVITDGGSSTYIIPVGGGEHIVQILYDSAALGTSGSITNLGFRLGNDANAFDHTDVHLVLGHTTLSSLGAASLAANIQSGRTAVFSGTVSIPAGLKAGDWVRVPLSTPFTYDPTKNLVVQWDNPGYATTNLSRGSSSSSQYTNHVQGNLGDRTSDVSNAPADFILDMSLTLNK